MAKFAVTCFLCLLIMEGAMAAPFSRGMFPFFNWGNWGQQFSNQMSQFANSLTQRLTSQIANTVDNIRNSPGTVVVNGQPGQGIMAFSNGQPGHTVMSVDSGQPGQSWVWSTGNDGRGKPKNFVINTADIPPGESRVVEPDPNTRGVVFRSPDGQGGGFSMTRNSPDGGMFMSQSSGGLPGGAVFSQTWSNP